MKYRGRSPKSDNTRTEEPKKSGGNLFYQEPSTGIVDSTPVESEKPVKKKGNKLLKIMGYVFLSFILLIVILVTVTNLAGRGNKVKATVSTPKVSNSSKSTAPSGVVNSSSVVSNTVPQGSSDTPSNVTSSGNVSTSSSSLFDSKHSQYVKYTNGYINMSLNFPRNWVVSEQTQNGFNNLQGYEGKGSVNMSSYALKGIVPVVDFVSPKSSTVKVVLYPASDSAVSSGKPVVSLINSNAKVSKKVSIKQTHIGIHSTTVTTFTTSYLGQDYYCSQFVFKSGKNLMLFLLVNTDSNVRSSDLTTVQEMIKTVSFSK